MSKNEYEKIGSPLLQSIRTRLEDGVRLPILRLENFRQKL